MKKLLLITIILFTTIFAQAQSKQNAGQETGTVVRLYPNPATSFITIDFENKFEKGYSIQIMNFLGRKMYEASPNSQRTTINLTDFNRGVYIYQLRDRNGKMVEMGKFQVSK